ncbi:PAS domain S-box protein [Microbacteriaceae bacterium K1510]|nr:PAS domain S-box protein [Microbacteriaceae bacterium K1510]
MQDEDPKPSPAQLESERNFRLLLDGLVDYAICMLDPKGHVTSWNAGAERIKGYKSSEILGRHFSIFYTERDREAGTPDKALRIAQEKGKFEIEGWRVRKDGSEFRSFVVIDALYEDGELIGFAKITRDVTERYEAQRALLESERQFRLLVSGVTDYALYMLDPQGNIVSWNAGGERIKGYAPDEIIGQHFSRFYTPADQADGKPSRALWTAQTSGRYEEEGWHVRKDGTFFWASVVIDPIRDDSGKLIGFAKITRDISERREAQIKLEKMQRQLVEAQKMDALGQLTGGVAHDFNNILMIVSGHLQTLKRSMGGDPRLARSVQAIEHATDRGATLTNQLLTFSRRQQVNPEHVNVETLVHSVREVLDSGLGREIKLDLDLSAQTWPVVADVSEFETALVNLVLNARDAMPAGGVVRISTKNVRYDEPRGEFVAITVADTGIGIAKDVMSKIFDPFFTTKPVGKGTGLGLSQVHGFVHQAGGTVRAESEIGKGTRITIMLPRAGSERAQIETGTPQVASGSGTVLLVEDNPDVASASAELLAQLGYAVRWVADAESALDAIERNGIDVVFSDIVMPGPMDGFSLAEAIKAKFPSLPILLTTGYSLAAQEAQRKYPILRKPYRIHELSRALAELAH